MAVLCFLQSKVEEINCIVAADFFPYSGWKFAAVVHMVEPEFDSEIGFDFAVAAVCAKKEFVLKFSQELDCKIFISAQHRIGIGKFAVEVWKITQQFHCHAISGDFAGGAR